MGLDMYLMRGNKNPDFKTEKDYSDHMDKLSWDEYQEKYNQIASWRKSNQIHNWFVENCQGGVDECQLSIVEEYQLRELLEICETITNAPKTPSFIREELASKNLPTTDGFFFGGTEYDEWYFSDVEETVEIINKVLEETDFETQVIFYRASW